MNLTIHTTDEYIIVGKSVSGMENSYQGAKQNTEHRESTGKKHEKHLTEQHNTVVRTLKYSNFNFEQNEMAGSWDILLLATDPQ